MGEIFRDLALHKASEIHEDHLMGDHVVSAPDCMYLLLIATEIISWVGDLSNFLNLKPYGFLINSSVLKMEIQQKRLVD